jgi:hypothetical protein
MTNLSPAAQAVLDAAEEVPIVLNYAQEIPAFCAAALRAAVAYTQQYQGNDCFSDEVWTCDADALLAIADELKAHG